MRARPFLMFAGDAEAALRLYASALPDTRIVAIERYGAGELGQEGQVKRATLQVADLEVTCIDSPVQHDFGFTPATSLFVEVDSLDDFDRAFAVLGQGGEVFMPPGAYGFSARFGWLQDRFGVSWQLNVA